MMEHLKSERISEHPNANVLVIFGGNVHRRNDIITLLSPIENLTIYATLSLEEGLAKMDSLSNVDLVLIGGRYSESQRITIKNRLQETYPKAKITEPGVGYDYSNENIFSEVHKLAK